ncbi:MAG: pyridoxal 5'-phosphate synthase glutaminase subunit PdxT [Clostridium argentinense]|nr:pyridoxal 5'-phosphate synthase glutaminase subunit PdxT [Clostridium argentinense]
MKIGVLCLQGAFIEHIKVLHQLGVECCEIRQSKDFTKDLNGLILPGGESTVIGKLLSELNLLEPIQSAINKGLPVFGTCAGLILLSKNIEGSSTTYLNSIDTTVKRNGYGRQLGSFTAVSDFKGIGEIPMVFIRAPYIISCKDNVDILTKIDEKIVAARQDNMLVTAFHPELTDDVQVHKYFLNMISESNYNS